MGMGPPDEKTGRRDMIAHGEQQQQQQLDSQQQVRAVFDRFVWKRKPSVEQDSLTAHCAPSVSIVFNTAHARTDGQGRGGHQRERHLAQTPGGRDGAFWVPSLCCIHTKTTADPDSTPTRTIITNPYRAPTSRHPRRSSRPPRLPGWTRWSSWTCRPTRGRPRPPPATPAPPCRRLWAYPSPRPGPPPCPTRMRRTSRPTPPPRAPQPQWRSLPCSTSSPVSKHCIPDRFETLFGFR